MSLAEYQAVVHDLYMVKDLRQREVLEHLRMQHGLHVSPQALKLKLKQWGFGKNLSRAQVMALTRAANGQAHSDQSLNTGQLRPAHAARLERYLQRNRIEAHFTGSPVPRTLASAQKWRVPERVFYENVSLIRGCFEANAWTCVGNHLIIHSSANQSCEKKAIMAFITEIDLANIAASAGQGSYARYHWDLAFAELDTLVIGQYHDSLPNILQKLNDLRTQGFDEVATQLQNYLSRLCHERRRTGPQAQIYHALRLIHLDDMHEIESRVMQAYVDLFERFLGLLHYNSFVMRMNYARRELRRDSWLGLDDIIPSLELFDSLFGQTDRRSLDIIRLRMETLYHRCEWQQTIVEAESLIARAGSIVMDTWQRLHFLIKGYYYLSLAQRIHGNEHDTFMNMVAGLQCMAEFCEIDKSGIFQSEEAVLQSYLIAARP